jgi:hypothetical protein
MSKNAEKGRKKHFSHATSETRKVDDNQHEIYVILCDTIYSTSMNEFCGVVRELQQQHNSYSNMSMKMSFELCSRAK